MTKILKNEAAAVLEARRQLESARNAVDKDKQQRTGSLVAKIVDALSTTRAEGDLIRAEEIYEGALNRGKQAAYQWVIATASQSLAAHPEDAIKHSEQKRVLESLQARFEKVHHLLGLAQDADRQLASAQSYCSSASTMELLDIASTNAAFTVLSHMETSDAADRVECANKAVRRLAEALPKRVQHSVIDQPDDLLDFIFDMTVSPSFDVFSLFNLSDLEDAESQCSEMADKLKPLLEKLRDLNLDMEKKIEDEMQALRNIEKPYIEAATAKVPCELDVLTPSQLTLSA